MHAGIECPTAEQQSQSSGARGSQVTLSTMFSVPCLRVRAGDSHYLHFPAGIDGLWPGKQLKQVTVRIAEVDAPAAVPII